MNGDHWNILEKMVGERMAAKGLKTISYAYKSVTISEFNEILENHEDIESPEFQREILDSMTYIGTFGLKDPVRPDIKDAIKLIKYGTTSEDRIADLKKSKDTKNSVNIRIVSGDHIKRTKFAAEQCGFVNEE